MRLFILILHIVFLKNVFIIKTTILIDSKFDENDTKKMRDSSIFFNFFQNRREIYENRIENSKIK